MNLPLPTGATPSPTGPSSRQQDQETQLVHSLRLLLGDVGEDVLAPLRSQLQWLELAAGQALMLQGEPGNAMYIVVSGRLCAYVRSDDGQQRRVREMARGQVIGEMSLFTDEPRSASVVAQRDSVLVRLDKPAFQRLLAQGGAVSMALSTALTRQLVHRLQQDAPPAAQARPVTLGLLPVTAGVDVPGFAAQLAQALGALELAGRPARVRVVDAAAADQALQQPGLARSALTDAAASRRIALWLDHVEANVDFVLLLADASPTPWTHRCSSHSDERLLLADATQPPVLHAIETELLKQRDRSPLAGGAPPFTQAAEILVLLHPPTTQVPRGTAAWLARRPLSGHLHLRLAADGVAPRDMARLARMQARQAVGLVLAGGGARGLAHLGVWRALRERGIEADVVGGTSIGAVMGALVASDRPEDHVMAVARRAFGSHPTGDFNLVPLLSLIKGRRLQRVIDQAGLDLAGPDAHIEDLWKPFFCIAANYTHSCEQVLRQGLLTKMIRASLSIPGALPPVMVDGELLCDGGTFNNFPVDVMHGLRGVGRVVGVDLKANKARDYGFDEVPSPGALLRDRLRPRARRRYRLPSLTAYLMNVTILYSSSRQRQARRMTDLYFNPPLERVGMLQWDRFEQIVQQGYEHAQQVLDAPPEAAPEAPARPPP